MTKYRRINKKGLDEYQNPNIMLVKRTIISPACAVYD